MKHLLPIIFFVPLLAASQQIVIKRDTFDIQESFEITVKKGMNKHHFKYRKNDFYNFNVAKKPVFESSDSIVYKLKFITPGTYLWDAVGTFTLVDNKIVCELKEFKQLKKTEFGKGVTYINMAVNDMEPTKGNRLNLNFLFDAVDRFFDIWH